MSLKVKIYGSRGSIPTPQDPVDIENKISTAIKMFLAKGHKFTEDVDTFVSSLERHDRSSYGGNTACYKVDSDKQTIIIDGGSGLRSIGGELMTGDCGKGEGEVHIFLTHFHWDHLIGFNFFIPLFIPGNNVHIYAVQDEVNDFMHVLFKKPYFPIPFEGLAANIHFHQLKPREAFVMNDMSITPYQLDHPDECWGYRVESDGHSYAHCVDTECTRMSRKDMAEDLPLYQNADLMIFDAQYSLAEAVVKMNWGHSAAVIGLDIARRESVKKIIFVHHDPYASDIQIDKIKKQCIRVEKNHKKYVQQNGEDFNHVEWEFGYDGLCIDLETLY